MEPYSSTVDARRMFSHWFHHEDLTEKLKKCGEIRQNLRDLEHDDNSPEMVSAIINTWELIDAVEAFHEHQHLRVAEYRKELQFIEKQVTKHGQLANRPRKQSSQKSPSKPIPVWEDSSSDEDDIDEIRVLSLDVHLVKKMKIHLSDQLFYEAVIAGDLETAMRDFVIRADLHDLKLEKCNHETGKFLKSLLSTFDHLSVARCSLIIGMQQRIVQDQKLRGNYSAESCEEKDDEVQKLGKAEKDEQIQIQKEALERMATWDESEKEYDTFQDDSRLTGDLACETCGQFGHSYAVCFQERNTEVSVAVKTEENQSKLFGNEEKTNAIQSVDFQAPNVPSSTTQGFPLPSLPAQRKASAKLGLRMSRDRRHWYINRNGLRDWKCNVPVVSQATPGSSQDTGRNEISQHTPASSEKADRGEFSPSTPGNSEEVESGTISQGTACVLEEKADNSKTLAFNIDYLLTGQYKVGYQPWGDNLEEEAENSENSGTLEEAKNTEPLAFDLGNLLIRKYKTGHQSWD